MTVEILPVGIKCNLSCTYCYQQPMRDAGNYGAGLKIEKMISSLDKVTTDFALFGGEALLTPLETLDKLFAYGFERFGKNGIQTNGLLINEAHIEMFRKYNVNIGISIDGPEECNRPRCPNPLDTRRIINNICHLFDVGLRAGLIVTIHKTNATHMEELLGFFADMNKLGMSHINLHNLEDDNCSGEALTNDENFAAFKTIYDYSRETNIKFSPFGDIEALLTQLNPSVQCIWNACDAYTTSAVHGIGPEGELVNCGRVNKDGIDWVKGDRAGNERYLGLYYTPQEHGGCKDCRYFYACKGNCPGTAIDGDWRNRTEDCSFWYQLMEYIEKDLVSRGIEVLSDKVKLELGEKLIETPNRDNQGDSHIDTPHGDAHGDHTDYTPLFHTTIESLIESGHAKLKTTEL